MVCITRFERSAWIVIATCILLSLGFMLLADVKSSVGGEGTGTAGFTVFDTELINDALNNTDTQLTQINTVSGTDYSLTWRGNITGVDEIYEAWYDSFAGTWKPPEDPICATRLPITWTDLADITLSAANNPNWESGINVITYGDEHDNITMAYGGYGFPWQCCVIGNDLYDFAGDGMYGTDVQVLDDGTVGVVFGVALAVKDLHFVECTEACFGCVQEDIDVANNADSYPALVYNTNLTRWEVMYLEMNAGRMRHAYRIAPGNWGDKGIVALIGGNVGWNRPGIDGVDISNTNETAWCARNLTSANLSVVYGYTGAWTTEDTGGSLGRYCAITINETEGPRSAHITYQGEGVDLWHAYGTLGTGVWTHELLDGNNSQYTDVLIDVNTDQLAASYSWVDDWSVWFLLGDYTPGTAGGNTTASNIVSGIIDNLAGFITWIVLIIIIISAAVAICSICSFRQGGV